MIWVSIAAGVSFSWVAADPDLGSRELHSYRRRRGGATAGPSCASAPRAMHRTPRHAQPRAPPSGRCSVAAAGDRPSDRSRTLIAHDVTVRRPGCTAGLDRARTHGGTTHQRRRSARPPARDFFPSFNVSMSSDSPRPPEVVTESEATCAVHAIPS